MGNENATKKRLNINCGAAYLLRDREGVLDKYDAININSSYVVTSSEINKKLADKNANIISGNSEMVEIAQDIIQLDKDTVISGPMDFDDVLVFAAGDFIIRGTGEGLAEAASILVAGTMYYPESFNPNVEFLAKVKGKKQAFPDQAYPVLGDWDLEALLAKTPDEDKIIWVSGKVTALDERVLAKAQADNLTILCQSLLIYESLNEKCGPVFKTGKRSLVPDGYAVTGNLKLKLADVYTRGPKLYVNGNLILEEKDVPCLGEVESIIVNGRATMPASAAQAFRKVGKAAEYIFPEPHPYNIEGYEEFSHEQLQDLVEQGAKLSVGVEGCLRFADDVTVEDLDAVASLKCEGLVLASKKIKNALMLRGVHVEGLMMDLSFVEKMTGKTIPEIVRQFSHGPGPGPHYAMDKLMGPGFDFPPGFPFNAEGGPGDEPVQEQTITTGVYVLI